MILPLYNGETREEYIASNGFPPEDTACHLCPWVNDCEFAYDPWNTNVEPGVDCLDAK